MEEFTHNGASYKAEHWLNGFASAEEFILCLTQKVIAGYKNYVMHGNLDKSEVINAEVEIIIGNASLVDIFVIANSQVSSDAVLDLEDDITKLARSVSASSHLSEYPFEGTIGLEFWFFQ